MLFKSKSVITVIGLGLFALVCVVAGALILNRPEITEFSTDGYILTASTDESAENVMVSSQIWFGQGSSWKEGKETVRFSDAQGNAVQVEPDSFIHYSDNSISAVTDVSVMNLDDFKEGKIQYYVLKQGVPLQWNGSEYVIGEGADAVSFSTFLMKSSDEHYLLGGDSMNLIQNNGQANHVDSGYLELEYRADDKSVALLNDGTNAWQILTEGAVVELTDGTQLDLSKGQLLQPQTEETTAQTGYYIDDIEISASQQNIWQSQNGYPVYRFTVINGEDGTSGADGVAGEDGEAGEEGEAGEQGTDGTAEQDGSTGSDGGSGSSGTIGTAGAGGGQMSGLTVNTSVPVISLKTWSVNDKQLKFTVYADEVSCNSIVENTTRISLVDIGTGEEVYWWNGDDDKGGNNQQIDLSIDSTDGFELYCNVLVPGHKYRLTVTAEYNVNDATGSQALLTRDFTADDYGIAFELTNRTSDSFTYALNKSNQLVDVEYVRVVVKFNGEERETLTPMNPEDFDGFTINLPELFPDATIDFANRVCDISFQPVFTLKSFDQEGNSTTVEVGQDGSIQYNYTVSTLKNEPKLGGVRLTAYDSGYLLAEALGIHDGNRYESVQDTDDAITKIRFELYDSLDALNAGTAPVATQEATSGYQIYFPVSADGSAPVHVSQTYYVRAYCTYDDGEKELTVPIMESYKHTADNETHANNRFAWDIATPVSLVTATLSFEGDGSTYNTTTEADAKTDSGITFNAIEGTIKAELSSNSPYVISTKHPMELHISASPDYYQSFKYQSISNEGLLGTTTQENDVPLSERKELSIPVDLTGLRANTAYMFTLYGYQRNGESYNRVTMGSVAVTTRYERSINLKLEPVESLDGSIGVSLRFQNKDTSNNFVNGKYEDTDTYRKRTAAAYRGLYSMTFELYRKGSELPLGTCTITNTEDDIDKNIFYEKFYGENAAKTLAACQSEGKKGIIGVGSDNYEYWFKNDEGVAIQPEELTDGEYCIKVSKVYDYTLKRYNEMEENPSGIYNYYTYKSSKENYINEIEVNENSISSAQSEYMEVEALPYVEPEKLQMQDGNYINVETLKNSDLGKYNGDSSQNALYSTNWEADTIAGLKLTCNYQNDAGLRTQTFSYYGFTYSTWKELKDSDTPTKRKSNRTSDNYQFKCSIDMETAPYQKVPEVWLLFYNATDLPYVDPVLNGNQTYPAEAVDGTGCAYRQTTTVNGKTVEIYYMNADVFARGKSYIFAYEAELPNYSYQAYNGVTYKGFKYPESIYTNIRKGEYKKGNTLTSAIVQVERQKPEIYSFLEKTEQSGGWASDTWKTYVNDPDYAIQWESILKTIPGNLPADISTSTLDDSGGIRNLFGTAIESMKDAAAPAESDKSKELTFLFSGKSGTASLDKYTVFNPEDENNPIDSSKKSLTEENLKTIRDDLANTILDAETQTASDRGGTITVSNLSLLGASYKLTADYLVLDEAEDENYAADKSFGNIAIVQHNYIGGNDYSKKENRLTLSAAEAGADHNTMKIYLDPPANVTVSGQKDTYYLNSEYLNKANTIAAVSLTAKSNGKDICERDTDGNITKTPKTLWLYPIAPAKNTEDYRYYLQFKLSDLDDSQESNIQYQVGDELTFSMKVYYLTGESGLQGTGGYSNEYYALKFVNAIQQKNLYGTSYAVNTARYRYTFGGTIEDTYDGAGRSFYHMDETHSTMGTLPWTQQFSIKSDAFDKTCTDRKLTETKLGAGTGYSGKAVLEAMKIDSYDADAQTPVTVESAAPSLVNPKASGGILQVNLKADVENWNLVEYPKGESLHLYYLIYDYTKDETTGNVTKGKLQGMMIGEPDEKSIQKNGGKLDVTFPFVQMSKNYWIEVYYKDKASSNAFDRETDEEIFGGKDFKVGYLYRTTLAGAEAQEEIVTETLAKKLQKTLLIETTFSTRSVVLPIIGFWYRPEAVWRCQRSIWSWERKSVIKRRRLL